MLLRWIIRLEKAIVTAVLLSYMTSYSIQKQHSIGVAAAAVSFETESMMENGGTTMSQECLPKRQRKIEVDEVFVVCDHQNNNDGEDDGSEDASNEGDDDFAYTNRPSCRTGDLGKVAIGFTVRNELPSDSTIFVSVKTHYFGRSATIRNRTDLCSFSNLGYVNDEDGSFYNPNNNYIDGNEDSGDGGDDDSLNGNDLCPIQDGVHYMLLESFTVEELSSSRKSSWQEFKPDLTVSFYLDADDSTPLIGCVQTGTKAKQALAQRRSRNGIMALIASIVSFVVVFGLCLHNQKQRRKAKALLENNRVASMIRRYNYRRSNTNGSSSGFVMMESSIPRRDSENDLFARGGPSFNNNNNSNSSRSFNHDRSSWQQPVPPRDPPPPWANQHM
mmetsp:Transcript_3450/g.8315  ORF Transcript_3450/g.8315 Transcript_3450/m.8315 type:complete len:388 (+) Transcript_3450:297-1460(+)|eukprot:CAMPEP_0172390414 /NCGR_PEP_ID=MMETSP1061-20121228/7063_1 /TAXON_ID=37318 /ORGANISM="Pseudo-nitzschia pungens, Strain cf. pungens" /LENGTH=387 /DNA_ID=CAMNT_0013120783 /DNA_START=194 /DNA_END=1357 /DNA_ORIENTATION=+